jgi:hypothetical protein
VHTHMYATNKHRFVMILQDSIKYFKRGLFVHALYVFVGTSLYVWTLQASSVLILPY